MDSITTALADGLQHRGVPAREANYAAKTTVTAYDTAWTDWIDNPNTDFSTLMQQAMTDLRTVVGDNQPSCRPGVNAPHSAAT